MYYEKLREVSQNANFSDLFPLELLPKFDLFIRQNFKQGNMYLSPYTFAFENKLSVKQAIKFFAFFTDKNAILEIIPFIECPKTSCDGNRIYIDLNTDYRDEPLFCDECGFPHDIQDIKHLIKVYYKLNSSILLPTTTEKINTTDPNSTFDALKELTVDLKSSPPSSTTNHTEVSTDGGDDSPIESVPAILVIEESVDTSGRPISIQIMSLNEMLDMF